MSYGRREGLHRPEDEPPGGSINFVNGLEEAVERAKEAAGGKGGPRDGRRRIA